MHPLLGLELKSFFVVGNEPSPVPASAECSNNLLLFLFCQWQEQTMIIARLYGVGNEGLKVPARMRSRSYSLITLTSIEFHGPDSQLANGWLRKQRSAMFVLAPLKHSLRKESWWMRWNHMIQPGVTLTKTHKPEV